MAHVPSFDQSGFGGAPGGQPQFQQQQQPGGQGGYPPQQGYPQQGYPQQGQATQQAGYAQVPQQQQQQFPQGGQQGGQQWGQAGENLMQQGIGQMGLDPMQQAAAQAGVGYLRSAMQGQVSKFLPTGVMGGIHGLKYYFRLNNAYLQTKIKILLAPYLHKEWERTTAQDTGKPNPPDLDVNAPDLYLPVNMMLTFALLVGYVKGQSNQFNPEIITDVMWSSAIYLLLEVGAIKVTMYLLQSTADVLDITAFCGYKYLALVINMIAGLFLGQIGYYVAMVYTGCMMAYFMIKSLSKCKAVGAVPPQRGMAILIIGAMQIVMVWFLGYSSSLRTLGALSAKAATATAAPVAAAAAAAATAGAAAIPAAGAAAAAAGAAGGA